MRLVFLVGLNHQFQIGPDGIIPVEASREDFSKFGDFLKSVIERHNIRGIAEEMSRCALRRHHVRNDSFPCQLAMKIGLPHCYCDPDAATQTQLNITEDPSESNTGLTSSRGLILFPSCSFWAPIMSRVLTLYWSSAVFSHSLLNVTGSRR
jgi:hypothetical protein